MDVLLLLDSLSPVVPTLWLTRRRSRICPTLLSFASGTLSLAVLALRLVVCFVSAGDGAIPNFRTVDESFVWSSPDLIVPESLSRLGPCMPASDACNSVFVLVRRRFFLFLFLKVIDSLVEADFFWASTADLTFTAEP